MGRCDICANSSVKCPYPLRRDGSCYTYVSPSSLTRHNFSAIIATVKPETLNDVLNTYRSYGHRAYGESVTELQHALQCAAFAQQAGEPPVVIAAALLHDYGHLCHNLGEDVAERGVDARHEILGAKLLKDLFCDEIVDAGRLHVPAKRYLCWKEAGYFDSLSDASKISLELQGGPMTDAEAKKFESEPHFELAVRIRRYDDMGKVPDMQTPDLDSYRPLLEGFVRRVA
ncbi:MAG: HD domain-containing protein [Verrucomicrobia bacterium]|nr:HD domain-containing protein [Verrucomicrobiota bacterium]